MGKLSIRDESVNDLAETLASLLGVSKTEAVRHAISAEIERQKSAPSVDDQVARLQQLAKDQGFNALSLDEDDA